MSFHVLLSTCIFSGPAHLFHSPSASYSSESCTTTTTTTTAEVQTRSSLGVCDEQSPLKQEDKNVQLPWQESHSWIQTAVPV